MEGTNTKLTTQFVNCLLMILFHKWGGNQMITSKKEGKEKERAKIQR